MKIGSKVKGCKKKKKKWKRRKKVWKKIERRRRRSTCIAKEKNGKSSGYSCRWRRRKFRKEENGDEDPKLTNWKWKGWDGLLYCRILSEAKIILLNLFFSLLISSPMPPPTSFFFFYWKRCGRSIKILLSKKIN